jgi:2C-methyl-D-erythritol 2,4-cyclodiphosphate synthase
MQCSNGTVCAIIEGKDNVNLTVFQSINAGSSCNNYNYVVEALNQVVKLTGVDLKFMFEERIDEDCKKNNPEMEAIKEQLEANKEAQFSIRKKKIAMLAEQYKNDPVRIALLNKVAKDLSILETQA